MGQKIRTTWYDATQVGHAECRAAAGHRWKENFRPARCVVLHGNLHFAAIREPSHIQRDEPHHGGATWVCALRHLSMPESRPRWSSRVYGRNVGEAISAPTGEVKWMLTVSASSARTFSSIARKNRRQTRGYVD